MGGRAWSRVGVWRGGVGEGGEGSRDGGSVMWGRGQFIDLF